MAYENNMLADFIKQRQQQRQISPSAGLSQLANNPADSTGNRVLDAQNIYRQMGIDISGLDFSQGLGQNQFTGMLGSASQSSAPMDQATLNSPLYQSFINNPPTYANSFPGSGIGSQSLTGFGPAANNFVASGGPTGFGAMVNNFTGGLTNAVSQGADFFKNLFAGENIGNIIGGVGGAIAQGQIAKDISALGKDATTAIFGQNYQVPEGGLIGQAKRDTEFKPFTVTTPTGTGSIGASGDLSLGLSPEQQALQKQFSTFATDAFGMLGDPAAREAEQANIIGMLTQDPAQRAAREQDVYNRLRAVQQPEEARAALALEERLFNQGRGGVRTAMYGGTPEQLAQAKAVEEAKALASVGAMDQARLEQALGSEQTLAGLTETRQRLGMLGDLGLSGLAASYLPQEQLIAAMQPSLEASRIGSALQSTGATLGAQLGETGLEAQLGYEALANAIRQQQFQGLFNMIMNQQNAQNQQNQQPVQTNTGALPNTVPSGSGFQLNIPSLPSNYPFPI